MADAAHHQASFIGGQWSPLSQGRSDLPGYEVALRLSLNGLPLEEGAWTRRSGTEFIIPTRSGAVAKLLPFYTTDTKLAYVLECTDSMMRFFVGTSPVFTGVAPAVTASSLSAGILSLTCVTTSIIVGDDVMLWAPATLDPAAIGPWRGRVLRVLTVGGGVITVGDHTGAAFVGLTSSANVLATCLVYQIDRQATTWAGQDVLQGLRIVPTEQSTALILSQTVFPQILNFSASPRIASVVLTDGPYLDQQGTFDTPETGTIDARAAGARTFTPASTVFTSTDVGRLIRLFSEPPAWASGTTYAYGATVIYNGEYWISVLAGNIGVIPGTTTSIAGVLTTSWAPAPSDLGGQWTWGTITAQAGASCTFTMVNAIPTNNSLTISIWRLGVFHGPDQYPSCGIFSDGRLFLGGAVPNRWDASRPNQETDGSFSFAPTDADGLVQDSNAISYTMQSKDPQPIHWFAADDKGLVAGTLTAEWLIASSALNEALTPTSAKATEIMHFGSSVIEPVKASAVVVFTQRYQQRVIELLSATAFSSRFGGHHLNEFAKDVVVPGIAEIVYQEEKAPIIWARLTDGTLASCTYRRVSPYLTEPPVIQAWSKHTIGSVPSRLVFSMAVQPSQDALSDVLYLCTTTTGGLDAAVEALRPIYEDA